MDNNKTSNQRKKSDFKKKTKNKKASNSNLDLYYKNNYKKNKHKNNIVTPLKKNNSKNNNQNRTVSKSTNNVSINKENIEQGKTLSEINIPIKKNKELNKAEEKRIVLEKGNEIPFNTPLKINNVKKNDIINVEPIKKKKKKILESEIIEVKSNITKSDNLEVVVKKKKVNRTVYGKSINLSNDDKLSKCRRKKIFFKEALFLSITFALVNLTAYFLVDDIMIFNFTNNEIINLAATFGVTFMVFFIISFLFDWLISSIIVHHNIKNDAINDEVKKSKWFFKKHNNDINNDLKSVK